MTSAVQSIHDANPVLNFGSFIVALPKGRLPLDPIAALYSMPMANAAAIISQIANGEKAGAARLTKFSGAPVGRG